MIQPIWTFEKRSPNGGASGSAYKSIFNGSGIEAAELLAREAIQNSVDAELADGPGVSVTLQMREYSGDKFNEIWEKANLVSLRDRSNLLGLPEGNLFVENEKRLRVLQIIDRGTTGLSGNPASETSHLRRLLMELGDGGKADEDRHSGGSFGFGKAVYSGSSRIATVLVFSRAVDENGSPLSVFMGCGYFKAHKYDGMKSNGRAFLGVQAEDEPERLDPYVGEEAEELAKSFDMYRDPDDIGTTIAILDCPLEMSQIRDGIEKSWWPRIIRDGFSVRLIDVDGAKLRTQPKKRPELRPFIEAMLVALKITSEQSRTSRRKTWNKYKGHEIGVLGLTVMDVSGDTEETQDEIGNRDSIAMIRSPGMVVYHYRKGWGLSPPIAGVFLADDDVDNVLRRSEPPEHNRWDEGAERLVHADEEPDLVRTIHERCWKALREFQRVARPSEPDRRSTVSPLERDLASLFGPTNKKPGPGPDHVETPVSFHTDVGVKLTEEGLAMEGNFRVKLKEEAEGEMPLIIHLDLFVRDERGRKSDDIILYVDHGPAVKELKDQSGKSSWTATLSPGKSVEFFVSSETYSGDWTVEFLPSVEPADPTVTDDAA